MDKLSSLFIAAACTAAATLFIAHTTPAAPTAYLQPSSTQPELTKLCITPAPAAKPHCTPPAMIWKLITADIDRDNSPEFAVALNATKHGRPGRANGLHIYKWNNGSLEPLWRGSSLSMPFRDATFADWDLDGHTELLALETNPATNISYLVAYSWNGFGFAGEMTAQLPRGVTSLELNTPPARHAPAAVVLHIGNHRKTCQIPTPPPHTTTSTLTCPTTPATAQTQPAASLHMHASTSKKDTHQYETHTR